MSEERKQQSREWMIERMQVGEFRHSDLYSRFGPSSPEYREADRLIQEMRKAGNISQTKRGVWQWCAASTPQERLHA